MPTRIALASAAVSLLLATAPAHAQSLRENSLQFSATGLFGAGTSAQPGGEIQYRLSPRAWNGWSLGAGAQGFYDPTKVCTTPTSCHTFGLTTVLFAEPRYVLSALSGDRSAAYLAGRLAYATSSNNHNGVLFGGGGGLLTVLANNTNLDLGVQVYTQGGSSTSLVVQLRAGLAVAF